MNEQKTAPTTRTVSNSWDNPRWKLGIAALNVWASVKAYRSSVSDAGLPSLQDCLPGWNIVNPVEPGQADPLLICDRSDLIYDGTKGKYEAPACENGILVHPSSPVVLISATVEQELYLCGGAGEMVRAFALQVYPVAGKYAKSGSSDPFGDFWKARQAEGGLLGPLGDKDTRRSARALTLGLLANFTAQLNDAMNDRADLLSICQKEK